MSSGGVRRLGVTAAALLLGGLLAAAALADSPPWEATDAGAVPDAEVHRVGAPPVAPLPGRPEPSLPATVTSADEREVTVEDVSRIVPLASGVAEILVALGLEDRLVARDETATFAQVDGLPQVTRGHQANVEGLLSLRPTLVLTDAMVRPEEAVEQLRGADVDVVVLDEVWALEEVAPRIRAVARAVGVPERGEELIARIEAQLEQATPPSDGAPTRVAMLYLRGSAGVYLLAGPGSGADDLIAAAGGVDAGSEIGLERPFTPLTSEALIEARPEVLLVMERGLASVGGLEGLLALPGVAQTPAGRDRRVVTVDDGLLLSFGPRTPQVVAGLAAALHDRDDQP